MIPLWMQSAGIALALGLALGFGGGMSYQDTKTQAAMLEQQQQAEKKANEIAAEYERRADEIRKQQRERTVTLYKEIEKPIYRDCVLPDSGRMLLDSAISAANSTVRGDSSAGK